MSTLDTPSSSFAVCAMVREDAATLTRFIEHYLALGAAEIWLFHDGEDPPEVSDGDGRVTLTACGAAFWASRPEGSRPHSLTAAQEAIFLLTRENSQADWLWITDADEFLVGAVPVSRFLAQVPASTEAVRVQTAEAIWGPGDDPRADFGCTYFRTPMRRRVSQVVSRVLYGKMAIFYRNGLLGHAGGKHFVRREAVVSRIGNHDSYRDGEPLGVWAHKSGIPEGRRFWVTHFDAVGFDRWREKWRRRYSGETAAPKMHPLREAQMAIVQQADAGGPEELRRLFEQLNTVSAWQVGILRAVGALVRWQVFAPDAAPKVPE